MVRLTATVHWQWLAFNTICVFYPPCQAPRIGCLIMSDGTRLVSVPSIAIGEAMTPLQKTARNMG